MPHRAICVIRSSDGELPKVREKQRERQIETHLGKALLVQGIHHDDLAVENGRATWRAKTTRSWPVKRRSTTARGGFLVEAVIVASAGPGAAAATATWKARMHGRAGRARL